ncbi:glycosyltransferase family 2 protein [Nodosilinea nodulosa]|uniref:glycosyltransferase family 2 protein n=1 Tax=Nodosilinea nodulosa TaxID=416001 RepID=UPI00030DDCF4|nr:glycosyltransferase family A protein [Nodosilinea nodulosa]
MKKLYATQDQALPIVSVIIMNYNYGSFLPVAIESCLGQTYPKVEVIVVDDGSTDDSVQVIESYGDRIIPVLKPNGGQASALNAGYAASRGDIICLLDADDLFLPERVTQVVELFQSAPDVDWVFTESAPIETEDIALDQLDTLFETIRAMPVREQLEKIDFRKQLGEGKIPGFTPSTSNLCFSRRISEKLFPLPAIKGLSGMAITDLYIKTPAVGLSLGYRTTKNLGVYRFHNNYYKNLNVDKKRRMFGEIYTTTGYWLKQNFPELGKISQKFLAKGYATYRSSSYASDRCADADCDQMLQTYLAQSPWLTRLEIYLMIAYYRFRLRFKSFV